MGKLSQEKPRQTSLEVYDEFITAEDGLLGRERVNKQTSKLWFISSSAATAFHLSVFAIYSTIFVYWMFKSRSDTFPGAGVVYSPAREAIELQSQIFDIQPDVPSTYFGYPSPEQDKAWEDLLKRFMRVSEDEFQSLGREDGVKLPGGGYLGTLMVYHHFHCLQRLHWHSYQDVYFPNITEEEKVLDRIHNKHCLNTIMLAIKCQADISLQTMQWNMDVLAPTIDFAAAPHECVNWDMLQDWLGDRVFDVYAPGAVVHPVLGPSFPDGKDPERIGVVVVDPNHV